MSKTQSEATLVLLNVRQVAAWLGVSQRSVWRLHDSGRMPRAVKLGSSVRWRRADIAEWVAMDCCSRSEFEARKQVKHAS